VLGLMNNCAAIWRLVSPAPRRGDVELSSLFDGEVARIPVIERYTGVLAAADVFTASRTYHVMQSLRLDLGYGSQVHSERRPGSDRHMDHVSISPEEAADRLAIRELVDAYAYCADTRDAEGQKALFTTGAHFVVYMEGEGSDATDDLHGRESLTPVFENLNTYEVTMHFNGQSTVTLDGDRGTGYTYCLAHHVYTESGERKMMVAALRYRDEFVREDGRWLFAERRLYLDWAETRTLRAA
jgi:hypothetical protein